MLDFAYTVRDCIRYIRAEPDKAHPHVLWGLFVLWPIVLLCLAFAWWAVPSDLEFENG